MNSKLLETAIKTKSIAKLKTCTQTVVDSSGNVKPVNIFDAASVKTVMGVDINTITYKGRPMSGMEALVSIISETVASEVVTHIQSMASVTTTVSSGILVTAPPPSGAGVTIGPGAGTGKIL